MTAASQATIVVVPRERFSCARRSLESIYDRTEFPFTLVYVDANSPAYVKRYLEAKAVEKGFELIRTNRYLSPNAARNLGLRHVKGKYVVFIDNDVLVSPGWLDALLRCAEETRAWVVGPLYLMGKPERQIIHMAGGLLHIKEEQGRRIFVQEDRLAGTPLTDVPTPLQRGPCELVEFHCMLVQTEVFDRLGPFDEELFSIHEHDDFCLAVRQAGGSIYLEPSAVVTYVPPLPLVWSDFPYFTLRWSKEWNKASLRRFHKKWNLDMSEDDPRYDWLWNRQYLLLRPLSRPLGPLQNLIQMVFGRRGTAWMKQTSLSFIRRVLSLFLVHGTRSKTRS